MKRSNRSTRKEELSKLSQSPPPLLVVPKVTKVTLRNIYGTRLVIGGHRTPSGKRYDFAVGEAQPVDPADVSYLLSLKRKQSSCCGGSNVTDLDYFELV